MELVKADFICNYLSIFLKRWKRKKERDETLRVRVHLWGWEVSSGGTA